VLSVFAVLLLAAMASADTLRHYENRVTRAREQVERIKTDANYSEQGVETIRELLPRTERIEHEGQSLDVDNAWLHVALDTYEDEKNQQLKVAKLTELEGRLRALAETLVRTEETPVETKADADMRAKLRNILNRSDYKEKEDSAVGTFFKKVRRAVTNFLNDIWAAFRRLLAKIFTVGAGGSWVTKALVVLVLGAIGFGLFRVLKQIEPRRKRASKRTVLGEEIEAGTTPRDLADAAMAAARAGDYRLAIRKLYVSLLYEMGNRELIELDDSLTNHEYLVRASRYSSIIPSLNFLTDSFDRHWYGMLPPTQEDFTTCLAQYNSAMERTPHLTPPLAA
jgi:TolA-binding protein